MFGRETGTGLARLLTRDGLVGELQARLAESDGSVAVLSFGIDGFTQLTDAYGLEIGDSLLHGVGGRIRSALPPEMAVAWLGGGEFVVLLRGSSDGEAESNLATLLDELFAAPFIAADGTAHRLSGSIGIAKARPGDNAGNALLDATIARRRAKRQPGSRVVWYRTGFREAARRRQEVENDLRETLASAPERLRVVYQPIVDLMTGQRVGYEALVRWSYPGHGIILPAEFIPIAEESGLIVELGEHVRTVAIREFSVYAPPTMSLRVNLSEYELADAMLAEHFSGLLAANNFTADRLCIEITETALARDDAVTEEAVARLRALGVGIALDDFGSGTASLSRLGSLPITSIKVPKPFVDALNGSAAREAEAVLTGLLSMAAARGLESVVEGVETEREMQTVVTCGGRFAQGYRFGRPRAISKLFTPGAADL